MDDKRIKELTEKILNVSHDKNEPYEFICALGNAKAFIENKLVAQSQKTMSTMQMKSFSAMISKFYRKG